MIIMKAMTTSNTHALLQKSPELLDDDVPGVVLSPIEGTVKLASVVRRQAADCHSREREAAVGQGVDAAAERVHLVF